MSRYVRLPTRGDDWRLMGRTARLVLTIPAYALVGVLAGLAALTLFVVSLQLTLVSDLVIGGALPLSDRLTILVELYPFVGTSFGPVQGVLLYAVAALTGTDVAMAVYHVREHGLTVEAGGSSLLGVVLGTLGAGCAACGSAVLLGALSFVGAQGLLLALPLHGAEFTLVAAAVLVLSIYWLADGMRGGEINGCPIDI